jgi:hypothetical protein
VHQPATATPFAMANIRARGFSFTPTFARISVVARRLSPIFAPAPQQRARRGG